MTMGNRILILFDLKFHSSEKGSLNNQLNLPIGKKITQRKGEKKIYKNHCSFSFLGTDVKGGKNSLNLFLFWEIHGS